MPGSRGSRAWLGGSVIHSGEGGFWNGPQAHSCTWHATSKLLMVIVLHHMHTAWHWHGAFLHRPAPPLQPMPRLEQLEASFSVKPAVPGIPERLTALEAVADSWRI